MEALSLLSVPLKIQDHDQIKLLVDKYNEIGPYYTSYPTLGIWSTNLTQEEYASALQKIGDETVALYVHFPYCKKLCWYCICNALISSDHETIQNFLNYLGKEVDLLGNFFKAHSIHPNIREIHLGGGTPSHMSNIQFDQLMNKLQTIVDISELDELAMEIDPRTTNQENLKYYASKGVTRISFGVQDFDPKVQKAINRVQPPEMIRELLSPEVRRSFTGFNFDLLYGLPLQTRETFRNTVNIVKELSPERITLLRYAHAPDIRKHMKLIKEPDLPDYDEMSWMFIEAVESFLDAGYVWIGIDNFAKPTDRLAQAVQNKTLGRDFNGWNAGGTKHLVGIGPTCTGSVADHYFQAVYSNKEYFQALDNNQFPLLRGYKLTPEDLIRREIIFSIICHSSVNFNSIEQKYNLKMKEYFQDEITRLKGFVDDGLLEVSEKGIEVTLVGRLFIRHIARVFDDFFKGKNYKILGP